MLTVTECNGAIATVELADTESQSRAVLAPSRGGLMTSLTLGGRELLFLDEATFLDLKSNVRGGCPVLFPSPGKLAGDAWARDGRVGSMKQHGFARNLAWESTGRSTDGGASVTLSLTSSDATRAQYPWDFVATFTYTLSAAALRIEQRFTSLSNTPMPFGAGFHPYFHVPEAEKASAQIVTDATRAFDNAAKQEVMLGAGIDLTRNEVDLHLWDHGRSSAELTRPGAPAVRLSGSPEVTHWVVWTLKGRDFVCLEPWTCPGNALNTGDRLLVLDPGESRTLSLEIASG
jgi:galactose mutarotase-like enzyme